MSSAAVGESIACVTGSLSNSFRQVPLSAIPAMLDCVLASSGLSPSLLFESLMNTFPDLTKEESKWDSDQCYYLASLVTALCHLLKAIGSNYDHLQAFLWRSFIPLMKMAHKLDRGLLNQIAESFFDVVIMTSAWKVLEATLIPYCLRSVGISIGIDQPKELDVFQRGSCMFSKCSKDHLCDSETDRDCLVSFSGSFPLSVSCQMLTLMLDASLGSHRVTLMPKSLLKNGSSYAEQFLANLLLDLCNLAEQLLSQSSEHRSCVIIFLLPTSFKAFVNDDCYRILKHGQTLVITRKYVFEKIWKCCKTLFSRGTLERKDAYSILSLYMSFFSSKKEDGDADKNGRVKEFDISSDRVFWDEIKRGLVDKESLVRKQSLQILKMVLNISGGSQENPEISENSQKQHTVPCGMTKRDLWADKEAKSLGVGKICSSVHPILNCQQCWEAFVLLYEMLEEYGTHLVEAAWNHQVSLLLQYSVAKDNITSSSNVDSDENQMETSGEIFNWLPILWERGFGHDNPIVRGLIMQSFLGIEWETYGDFAKFVPDAFVCGPFMQGLNDPVHHDDFGSKGVHSSRTIQAAARFVYHYMRYLDARKGIAFLRNLSSIARKQSLGRTGLMSLAECIASAASGLGTYIEDEAKLQEAASVEKTELEFFPDSHCSSDKSELLEDLRFVVESSKQHFNPNYRLQVCEKLLHAASSTVCTSFVPLDIVLHFASTFPREFTDTGGFLREKLHGWLLGCGNKLCSLDCCGTEVKLLKSLHDFPRRFTSYNCTANFHVTYDDEDLDSWESEAKKWARLLFLLINKEDDLEPVVKFILDVSSNFSYHESHLELIPVKFLILILSLVLELQIMQERGEFHSKSKTKSIVGMQQMGDESSSTAAIRIYEIFANHFCFIMDKLISFAKLSCSIFWSGNSTKDTALPGSVRGKLGGASQRRLPSATTSAVLLAIMSMKAIASISSWCAQYNSRVALCSASTFLWEFIWRTISSPTCNSEIGAEISLAAYEAMVPVLRALVTAFCPSLLNLIKQYNEALSTEMKAMPMLDAMVQSFLQNVNSLLAVGVLARTRLAILMNWKWLCLEYLLSIPYHADGYQLKQGNTFFSGDVVRLLFTEIVESLENAGEGSVLPMLRSVRLVLGLLASGGSASLVSACSGLDVQMMWDLVHSSWILHVNCNKRRVAPIAALLSSVLHSSVFGDEKMHVTETEPGPLKWFIEKVIEEGTKSPRTIRLAALHLTGIWLSHPKTLKYYMKELKLLSLYGSVAFDEDFEGELTGNQDARAEVLSLAKSPDPELTEAFINTELYARVSVAVLFYNLADAAEIVGSSSGNDRCHVALEAGKLFLLELMDSVVNDKDLSKELYKKYSAIHRRKTRAWQMICVLSRFVNQDILGCVTQSLQISLYRNNLPAVRQYLETFAINLYLKFPSLVSKQLVPVLRDYNLRPQALSSYVFIAANVILHSPEELKFRHLEELLPPIIPLLTSHHHSLRGFAQLLVHSVLCKLYPFPNSSISETVPLEKKCFEDLKLYLAKNSDCMRLRASMEGYLHAYDPHLSVTPAGIFINRVEELEFECVPTSLMDQVLNFLNDTRDDLRCSMAKDAATIKNESLSIVNSSNTETSCNVDSENFHIQPSSEMSRDFQKKITPSKYEQNDNTSNPLFSSIGAYKQLMEMEKEDQLFDHLLHSRNAAMEKVRGSRQSFILVASLLDRVPNLAGLARTCEVFKASGLAIADKSILRDKQFQLISVTAEKWVPIIEVPSNSVKIFLEMKKREGFSILGLEQTANSIALDQYTFPQKTVLVLGREKEGIPVDIIHILDACVEIPQLGVVRSLNVHVSGAIALWEYTRQQRSR